MELFVEWVHKSILTTASKVKETSDVVVLALQNVSLKDLVYIMEGMFV